MGARLRRVGILGHTTRPAVRRAAGRLAAQLARSGRQVRIAEDLAREMDRDGQPIDAIARWCQALISLGGDGTALKGARAMAGRKGVLLPVNLGGLGFLTVAEEDDLGTAVNESLSRRWPVVKRRMVAGVVRRRDGIIALGRAMNDAVIKSAGGYSALHLRITTLGQDLGHLVADGLICATASGSTAYSLSAGGPVLAPDTEAFVMTPVCPHTLGSRPLVLSPGTVVHVKVLGTFDHAILLFDGQESVSLEANDEVELGLSRTSVRIFENPVRPFGHSLLAKLGWQGSERRSM